MIKQLITLALSCCFIFQLHALESEQKTQTEFSAWLSLHQSYAKAMDALNPEKDFSSIEFFEEDFVFLQESNEAREQYMEILAQVEYGCEMNRSLPACRELLEVIVEKSMISCFGEIDTSPATQSVRKLQENIETVWLASTRNEFKNYSESQGVENMIARLKGNLTLRCTETRQSACRSKRRLGSLAQCLRYVKLGLIGGGYMRANPGVASAWRFGPQLKKMGFKNLKDDPRHANMTSRQVPHGAILVYSSSDPKRPHGHIEVYDAKTNQYLSDFASNNPIDTYNGRRRLIGIYVK